MPWLVRFVEEKIYFDWSESNLEVARHNGGVEKCHVDISEKEKRSKKVVVVDFILN